jgi:hypothetical protein
VIKNEGPLWYRTSKSEKFIRIKQKIQGRGEIYPQPIKYSQSKKFKIFWILMQGEFEQ